MARNRTLDLECYISVVGLLCLIYVNIIQLIVSLMCGRMPLLYSDICGACAILCEQKQKHVPGNKLGACHFILISAPRAFFQLGISPLKTSFLDQLGADNERA